MIFQRYNAPNQIYFSKSVFWLPIGRNGPIYTGHLVWVSCFLRTLCDMHLNSFIVRKEKPQAREVKNYKKVSLPCQWGAVGAPCCSSPVPQWASSVRWHLLFSVVFQSCTTMHKYFPKSRDCGAAPIQNREPPCTDAPSLFSRRLL